MLFANMSPRTNRQKALSGSFFLFLALWASCGEASAGSYSADDYHKAEIRQLEAIYSRFATRCDGFLFFVSGDEYDRSAKIVFILAERNLATTAEQLNDPGLVATARYDIYIQARAYRRIPSISLDDLSLQKATDWSSIAETMLGAKKDLPHYIAPISTAYFNEYQDAITLTSLPMNSVQTPSAGPGEMMDAIYDVVFHPERPWQKMSCASFESYDTAIANFFMLENGDHSILDRLTDPDKYHSSSGEVVNKNEYNKERSEIYRKWLYPELRRIGVMSDNDHHTPAPDISAPVKENTSPSPDNNATDKAVSGKDMWTHNGSVVEILATPSVGNDGTETIEIRYVEPKTSLTSEGVGNGTLLFNGTRKGTGISGTIRIFNRKCGTLEYAASGVQSSDSRIDLKARRPVRANCAVTDRFVDENLAFEKK